MKRLLVIADSHGSTSEIEKVLKEEKYDIAINLGDTGKDEEWVKKNFDYYVTGNNDKFETKKDKIIDVEGVTIGITHGDDYEASLREMFKYNERVSRWKLIKLCRDTRANIILYGHSHIKDDTEEKNYRIINPGSIAYPRDDRQGSYAIIEINSKDDIKVEFVYV